MPFASAVARPLGAYARHRPGRRIGVLDLGCGGGTVAFALDELFAGAERMAYVGFDHHATSRQICAEMLHPPLGRRGSSVATAATLRHAFDLAARTWPDGDRVFVTCSYLLCQDTVSDATVDEIATRLIDLT